MNLVRVENEKKLIEERQSLLKTQKERTDLLAQCDIFESQIKDLQKTNDQLQGDLERVTSDGGQLSTMLQSEVDVLRKKLDGMFFQLMLQLHRGCSVTLFYVILLNIEGKGDGVNTHICVLYNYYRRGKDTLHGKIIPCEVAR